MFIKGFKYAAAAAGIRNKERLDVGLIYSEVPATAAAVFTTNRVKAAPVLLDMEKIEEHQAQAILVNSGIANACTGEQGLNTARSTATLAAKALGIPDDMVQVASTGVIGEQLEVEKFEQVMATLVSDLSADAYDDVSSAIMTTDTVKKTAARTVMVEDKEVKLFGMAKGAGMIMPNMATMLCFVLTDARITAAALTSILKASVDVSFNRITVDGDTSTNDMVLILANGTADNHEIHSENTEACKLFSEALADLLKDLALQIVADGEGATKIVTIHITGAMDDMQADMAARTIANSALVKTAFFGEDANWGRIIAALGRSGAEFDPDEVDISFDDVFMVKNGLGQGNEVESKATEILKKVRFTVAIDLKTGNSCGDAFTCDFSLDYVKINADYRS